MTRIFVIGYTLPSMIGGRKIEAANYRTWQFVQPILEEGHQVYLCAMDTGEAGSSPPLTEKLPENLTHQPIHFRKLGWPKILQKAYDHFDPDCVAAINFDCCLFSTKLKNDKPVWMDIYGDYLTIVQAARYRAGSNRGVFTSIRQMQDVLQKGDIFSGCGKPQTYALMGELAMSGRLNYQTFGYEFTRVILPGAPPSREVETDQPPEFPDEIAALIAPGEKLFLVLWCGGYNTWTDVVTLFKGLEMAMAQEPRVHFISIGANTYKAKDNVYNNLLRMVDQSQFRDHFHLLGWRPWEEISGYYKISKTGLNIDAIHYETTLGTRTRLVEMMASGLPIITSRGTDLSTYLGVQGVALNFDVGDWNTLGENILILARDPQKREKMAQASLDCARNELSFRSTTAPFIEWLSNPRRAPDHGGINTQERIKNLEYQSRSFLREMIWRIAGLDK